LNRDFSVGTSYRLTAAHLQDDYAFAELTSALGGTQKSLLHQIDLHANFNDPSGLFAQFQAVWNDQSNSGYQPGEPGDNFWQLNLFAGYRSPRRHWELRVGLLNLTARNYQLNPLTLYNDTARTRTLAMRLKFDF
jgi:hypothetical protein